MAKINVADKVPDWELKPESEWNAHQRLAANTNGIVTLANGISLAGAALVTRGVYNFTHRKKAVGAAQIAVGRGLDIVDGKVSDWAGTKGPTGEAVDAGLDKVQIFAVTAILKKAGVIPPKDAAIALVQNGLNVGATAIAKKRGIEIHPDEAGKKTTFGQWMGIVGHTVANIIEETYPEVAECLHTVSSDVMNAASIGLGGLASKNLVQTALSPVPEPVPQVT